jgi:hypothetical protein
MQLTLWDAPGSNYMVLDGDADFSEWFVSYGCADMFGIDFLGHYEWAYIYSRNKTLAPEFKAKAIAALDREVPDYNRGTMWATAKQGDEGNCKYSDFAALS